MYVTSFGKLPDGREAQLFHLENKNGTAVEVTNFGVNIVSTIFDGTEVTLGYDSLDGYEDNHPMLGATIGRNVNRISNAAFDIDGTTYHLDKNRGKHNIHSDKEHGFHKVLWDYQVVDENAVVFTYVSPHGEQGFPGTLKVSILYTLTDSDGLMVSYCGVSDQKTLINITNHNYFNLDGHNSGSILNTKVKIYADAYTPVDEETIPTGEIRKVEHSAMDFRNWKTIEKGLDEGDTQLDFSGGYDHNFVINHQNIGIRKVAEAVGSKSNIRMELYSDLPGLQFYSGNSLQEPQGKTNTHYEKYSGFCMEPQFYPNSVNTPEFDAPIFDKGEIYKTTTIYQFTKWEEHENE